MISVVSLAQTEQGVFRIGGDISFDHSSSGNYKENLIMTRVQPALFLARNILVGVNVAVDKYWEYSNRELLDIETEIKIGPDVTYYCTLGDSKIMIPVSVYGGYLGYYATQRSRNFIRKEKSEGFYYGGSIGIEFIPEEHVGLRLTFGPNFRDLEAYAGRVEEDLVDWRLRFGCGYYLTRWKTPSVSN